MKRNILLAAALLLSLILVTACLPGGKQNQGPRKFEAEFIGLFDTLTRVMGYAENEEDFKAVVQGLKDDLEVYHRLYDIYDSYPDLVNIKTVNSMAGQGPVAVDRKIIDLLLYSKDAYQLTEGRVNIALGAVTKIWHRYRSEGVDDPASARLPKMELLEEAALHTRMDNLLIDPVKGTVELKDPKMSLDVGAIAKGYAVEQAARAAEERGVKHLLISVGGNVRAIGARNDQGEPWRVGIENPDYAADDYLAIVKADAVSVVTSGVYERFYMVGGKSYHHIIDPDTLFPENRYLSVSIVTPDSGLADVLSTALFNLDLEEGKKLIGSIEGTEALWCMPDGSLVESDGFADLTILD
ncbi:MAG: FAD:protein FMN transferase [Clostridiaceae bacterium]|nr:FAD:protein FMN transferase [Clostridiaceae bacterium]